MMMGTRFSCWIRRLPMAMAPSATKGEDDDETKEHLQTPPRARSRCFRLPVFGIEAKYVQHHEVVQV
jgi:hypothetical protein